MVGSIGPLADVAEGAAVLHIGDPAVGAGEIVLTRVRVEVLLEQRMVGLEAVGIGVGDVVGDDIHLPFQRHLP
ncbi:hypothetical protein ACVWW7_000599 [Bradyrhizobium sp. LM6.9]